MIALAGLAVPVALAAFTGWALSRAAAIGDRQITASIPAQASPPEPGAEERQP